MKYRRLLDLLAFAVILGTYWTIEVFYAWYKAWGDPHFDNYFSLIAYAGIIAAGYLLLRGKP